MAGGIQPSRSGTRSGDRFRLATESPRLRTASSGLAERGSRSRCRPQPFQQIPMKLPLTEIVAIDLPFDFRPLSEGAVGPGQIFLLARVSLFVQGVCATLVTQHSHSAARNAL